MLIQQERFAYRQVVEMGFKGIADVLPLVAILFLSIGLGASVRELGTGVFISGLVADYLPLFMVPAVVFLAGAFASFSTGTSCGTFALLVPIAMPISAELNLPPSLILAAVLGGGIFGDHSSPYLIQRPFHLWPRAVIYLIMCELRCLMHWLVAVLVLLPMYF